MNSQAYIQERRAFEQIKKNCSEEVKSEYELAINTLVRRYNTTIHENRFVVGGAVEEFTWALLRSVDVECELCGSQSPDGDIELPNDELLSIKSSFRGVSDIKLINQMGTGDRPWTTATLFIVSGVGIVYGAPDMVDSAHVKPTGDGVSLKRAGLQKLMMIKRTYLRRKSRLSLQKKWQIKVSKPAQLWRGRFLETQTHRSYPRYSLPRRAPFQ